MKRIFALLLASALVVSLAACGKQNTTQFSGQSSGNSSQSTSSGKNNSASSQSSSNTAKKTVTAAQLVAALEKAGYMVEEEISLAAADFDDAAIEGHYYYIGRFFDVDSDIGEEPGTAIYIAFANDDDAVSVYNEILRDLDDEYPFKKSTGADYSKAVAVAQIGRESEYGETYIVCRVKNTIISLYVDWDDYQDSRTTYDHAAQKALESLGY